MPNALERLNNALREGLFSPRSIDPRSYDDIPFDGQKNLVSRHCVRGAVATQVRRQSSESPCAGCDLACGAFIKQSFT